DGFALSSASFVGTDGVIIGQALDAKADELYQDYVRDREQFPDARIPTRAELRAQALVELIEQAHGVNPASSTPQRANTSILIHTLDGHDPRQVPGSDPSLPPELLLPHLLATGHVDGA